MPAAMRASSAAVYAFCRVADDLIDLGGDAPRALEELHMRLERLYRGVPVDHPADRAFSVVVHRHEIPCEIPLALLEGFAWDAANRQYDELEELEEYCARVASTVGVMMTLMFGVREPGILARAGDLGVAMQLTNIARDVGEDARAGRLYLPRSWLVRANLDPDAFLAEPRPSPELAGIVRELLDVAAALYRRADAGIGGLPVSARVPIRAARLVYADISRVIARQSHDTVSRRAVTSKARKLLLLARALPAVLWRPGVTSTPALPSVQPLIDAVTGPSMERRALA